MLLANLALACLLATAAAGPIETSYDQRQDGDFNARLDISNILFFFAVPKKLPTSLFDIFSKSGKPHNSEHEIQDRSDFRVMEAFVEPNTPYRVEIGSEERSSGSDAPDGRAVEVVIAGRRRLETEPVEQIEPQVQEKDELKLLGATENCGPDRVRDSVTLMCKDMEPAAVIAEPIIEREQTENKVVPEPTPEVIPS